MICDGVMSPGPLLLHPAMYKTAICKTFPPNLVLGNSRNTTTLLITISSRQTTSKGKFSSSSGFFAKL